MTTGLNRLFPASLALVAAGCNPAPKPFDSHCPKIGTAWVKGVDALKRAQVCMDAAAVRMSGVTDGAEAVAKAAAVECSDQIDRIFEHEEDRVKADGVMKILAPRMIDRSAGLVVAARSYSCMANEQYRTYVEKSATAQ